MEIGPLQALISIDFPVLIDENKFERVLDAELAQVRQELREKREDILDALEMMNEEIRELVSRG